MVMVKAGDEKKKTCQSKVYLYFCLKWLVFFPFKIRGRGWGGGGLGACFLTPGLVGGPGPG